MGDANFMVGIIAALKMSTNPVAPWGHSSADPPASKIYYWNKIFLSQIPESTLTVIVVLETTHSDKKISRIALVLPPQN